MALIKHGGVFGGSESKTNPDTLPEMYPPPKFYIAGPFFNPVQLTLIQMIETAMVDNSVPFFSPRQTPRNEKKELDDEDAREIFKDNVREVLDCGAMLAVLDWAMPAGQALRVCDAQYEPIGMKPRAFDLNLPDTGTTWEMGFAFNKRPIYGFTMREPGEKVNIMLTQCLEGVIHGFEELHAFLNHGWIRPSVAKKGSWKHR